MESSYEGASEISRFHAALRGWAKHFAMQYRSTPRPPPTFAEAAAELRRWSREYWAQARPESAAMDAKETGSA